MNTFHEKARYTIYKIEAVDSLMKKVIDKFAEGYLPLLDPVTKLSIGIISSDIDEMKVLFADAENYKTACIYGTNSEYINKFYKVSDLMIKRIDVLLESDFAKEVKAMS